jgi:hypothetical protein
MVSGIGSRLTNDAKRADLTDLRQGGARCTRWLQVIAFLVCGVGGQSRKSIGRNTG